MSLSVTPITAVAGTPKFFPPATGTTVNSADVKALAQATADRFAELALGTVHENHDEGGSAFATWSGSMTYDDADGGSPAQPTLDIAGLLVGDVLEISFNAILSLTTGGGGDLVLFRHKCTDDVAG